MGQISAYQEAPYQGVSQAPAQVRRRDQAQALEDCFTAIPQGLQKRPPFQLVDTLSFHPGHTNGVFQVIERGAGNMILTLTREGSATVPRLYTIADAALNSPGGNIVTIDAATQAYLNANVVNPHTDLGAVTIVDYTFVWNRTSNTANSSALAPTRPHEGLIWVKGGAYGKNYGVTVSGAAGTANVFLGTPDGTAAANSLWVDTDKITAAMVGGSAVWTITGTNSATYGGDAGGLNVLVAMGYTVTRIGSVIYISHPTADFIITVLDGQGGAAAIAVKDKVQKFADLPAKCFDGFTVRVVQQSGTALDDYFVKFSKSASDGTGVWEECIGPGAPLGLDPNTLPHAAYYSGGWFFGPRPWKQRTTGDATLVKDPDFIGQSIRDLTFWQGRIALVSGEGVTLSTADDPFQFYPRTLASVLDSDPIGRVNPAPGETIFRYAVPYEGRLVLCGDTVQAHVTSDGILSPLKASIDTFTSDSLEPAIRPFKVNNKLYFASPKGGASGIREVAVDRVTNTALGEDLTTAAFRYLPRDIDRVASCKTEYIACYGTSGSSDIYVHLFRYVDGERAQNAFERWHLPLGYSLGGMFFLDAVLYVLACKGGIGYVLKLDLTPLAIDGNAASTIETMLDLKMDNSRTVPWTYDATKDQTTITLPFPRSANTRLVFHAPGGGAGTYPEGYQLGVDQAASALAGASKMVVSGNLLDLDPNYNFYVGDIYTSEWDLSRLYPLDAKGKPLRNGRCQVRRINLDIANTGYLRAEVTCGGRAPYVYEFFGFRYDEPGAALDKAPSATTVWGFPVMGQNEQTSIKLINDSPYSHSILGFEWVGEFNPKSQRT